MRYLALGLALLVTGAALAQGGKGISANGLGTTVGGTPTSISINGGQTVGNNIFHSFTFFDLQTGQTATFFGPGTTANIIARVTGGPSWIDGTLKTSAGAATSLWFINPAGLAFGQNASLDVTGSFHAATAHAVKFGASGQFDLANPPAGTLSVSPTAFVFLSPPAPLTVSGSLLQVPTGQQLTLAGGDLTLTGATLHAPTGQVNLASVAGPGEVTPGAGSLAATGTAATSQITLTNSSVDTWSTFGLPGSTSGSIFIRGGKLTLNQSTVSTEHTGVTTGGKVDIALAGDLAMNGGLVLATGTGTGRAGDVAVSAGNITMSNVSVIDTSGIDIGFAGGQSGQTTINAGGNLALSGGSQVTSVTATGTGGDVNVTAANVSISGAASMINVVTVDSGTGGNIVINTGNLSVAAGGRISAGNEIHPAIGASTGSGGTITINATDSVALSGGSILSSNPAFGNAGAITINAGHAITLGDGAQIATSTNAGQGGQITLTAADLVSLSNSRITTSVADGTGNGGDILIDPSFVTLSASQIIAQTFNGLGGHINIITPNFVSPDLNVAGGSLVDASALGGNGVPGTVQISSPNVDAGSALAVLPSSYFDPSAMLRESCAARAARASSSFVAAGRGALPAGPDAARYGPYALGPAPLVVADAAVRAPYRARQSALQGCSG